MEQLKAVGVDPWPQIIAWTNRRQRLCRGAIPCPRCGTRQVQLLWSVRAIFAEWRCRECRHRFFYEPLVLEGHHP